MGWQRANLFPARASSFPLPTYCRTVKGRSSLADFYDMHEISEERMVGIRPIESMITIGPTLNNFERAQFLKLLLDRGKRQAAHSRQLAHITLFEWEGEQ